ncbi:hypothetical protein CHS0354_032368 [Potamilus streckersoni]|uniref:Uncharacterized protein n=1 Tax=Potamilus streckersoni TaxID=2493646 RepID=A0AAE0WCV5_9BIVA|nr:hypothetical protein CHS0354_032368 [Potamilus streckersoni]
MDIPNYYNSGQNECSNNGNMPYNGPVYSQVQRQAPPSANNRQLSYSSAGNSYPPSGASDRLQKTMDASRMTSGPSNPYGNHRMLTPVPPRVSPAYNQVQGHHYVNPFVGQLATSSVRRSSQASDLQKGTDFSMMTSPPSNPHSTYRMFSPVVPSVSTTYNSGYLNNLQRNPMFQDPQILLNQECNGVQVPANLITTSWNLMPLPSMDSSPGAIRSCQNVYLRHMQLQDKLLKVRNNPYVSADGLKVDNEYSTNVGQIEMGRYHALASNMGNTELNAAVYSYYDKERLMLVQKVEAELDKLIDKVEKIQKSVARANLFQQKESSQGRPLMNAVKTDRGVQQHTFEGLADVEAILNNDKVNDTNKNCAQVISVSPSCMECSSLALGGLDDAGQKDSFDYGFTSDLEDLGADVEAILNNDKVNDTNKNCAQVISMSPLGGIKQNNTGESFDHDEKCAEKTNFFQPDSMVNLSAVEPVTGESCLINNDTLMTPDQCGSSQAAFLDLNLSFISTPEVRNNPSVELSPLNDQDDFLLRIACGISENSNDVQSNSQSQARSPIARFDPELQASSSSQQNSDLDKPVDSTFDMNPSMENKNLSSHVPSDFPCLSSDSTNILSMCELQLQYPYPVKEEVKELVQMTGVTHRPMTKWMVNKHSPFSTLSITEDNRPIEFKCKGKGKKRKHSELGKDN